MFPGMGGRGGMNPRKLNAMMKQLGIEVDDIDDVEEVIIRTADREIFFRDATVSKMIAQGSTTWQVMGTAEERPRGASSPATGGAPVAEAPKFTEEDVKLVAENANVSLDAARAALVACDGEPAEAILHLLEKE